MAIDPRISLAIQKPQSVSGIFQNALTNIGEAQRQGIVSEQAPLQNQLLQLRTELQQAQQPALMQQAERAGSDEQQLIGQQQQMQQIATGYATALQPLLNNPEALVSELQRQKQLFSQQGIDTHGIDEDIVQAQTPQGLQALAQEVTQILMPQGQQQKSVSQREREQALSVLEKDSKMETVAGKEAGVFLGLRPRASISAEERIAQDIKLAELVAENKRLQAEKTETGKLSAQKKFKPEITKAVKLAEKEATEKGEVLTDLARMEASLPGVKEAVSQLIELSNVATSTLGGRAFDFLVKESGFGSTKGADARAKLIAIVDNQVLPLLKETFGAAFTVQEGENLKASLVDPNASPSQKREQLDAFLAQKERNIKTKQQQLGASTDSQQSSLPQDLSTLSLEELKALRQKGGG